MKRIVTGILASLSVFVVARILAALLGLDVLAQNLARAVLQVPNSELYLAIWLLCGLAGIVALVLWLVFNTDENLANLFSPRPFLGSLPVVGAPAFKMDVNETTGKNTAELFVELINNNREPVAMQYVLRATVNGKDLDRPVAGKTFASPGQKIRLFVRIDDAPVHKELLARLEYEVTYSFKASRRKTRFTAKGIEWKSRKPASQPGPGGAKVNKTRTVKYYNEREE